LGCGLILRTLLFVCLILCSAVGHAQYVTLTGVLSSSSGLPAKNATLSFRPSQVFFVAGTSVVVMGTQCGTDSLGNVVGIARPVSGPRVSAQFTGTLPVGNYYVVFAWYDASGNVTQVSPEVVQQLTSTGELQILPPVGNGPASAVGMRVYIGTAPGNETLQGSTNTTTAQFTQAVPLVTGAAQPTSNTTICKVIANDVGWPTGTGYNVSLVDGSGNTLFSYPELWQFYGAGSTYNLSQGIPYYHGQVIYPVPVLTAPYNHNVQSISGPLDMTDYNLVNVNLLGVGTQLPAWGVDVEGAGTAGQVNAIGGYLVNGSGGTTGQCLGSDGTAYDVPIACLTSAISYYQTMETNGTVEPQRFALNFSPRFALSDTSTPSTTGVELAASGVTAGACAYPSSVTFDVYGRATSCTPSVSVPGIDKWVTFTSCVPASDGDNQICQGGPISWPTAFADTAYVIDACMVDDSSTYTSSPPPTAFVQAHSKTTTGFSYTLTDVKGSSGPYPYSWPVTCHGHHP
jgi:hypothetical protein